METLVLQKKNQEAVKIFSWFLIVISTIVLVSSLIVSKGYSAMITMQGITKNFDPPIGINFTLYFIQNAVELLLCVVVFVSATFVMKYRERWRKVLIYGLIISIIFLMISPIINYYNMPAFQIKPIGGVSYIKVAKTSILIWSYSCSIIISVFFIVVILKLSKEEVRLLFK